MVFLQFKTAHADRCNLSRQPSLCGCCGARLHGWLLTLSTQAVVGGDAAFKFAPVPHKMCVAVSEEAIDQAALWQQVCYTDNSTACLMGRLPFQIKETCLTSR